MKITDALSLPSSAQEDLRLRAEKQFFKGKSTLMSQKYLGVMRQAVGRRRAHKYKLQYIIKI